MTHLHSNSSIDRIAAGPEPTGLSGGGRVSIIELMAGKGEIGDLHVTVPRECRDDQVTAIAVDFEQSIKEPMLDLFYLPVGEYQMGEV